MHAVIAVASSARVAGCRSAWDSSSLATMRLTSEVHFEVDMKDGTVRADRHRVGGVADRASPHVDVFAVETQTTLLDEVPVGAGAHLPRVAVRAEDFRVA